MNELKLLDGMRVNKNNNYFTNNKKLIDQLKINHSTFELLFEDIVYPEYNVDKKVGGMYPYIFERIYKNKDNFKKVGLVNIKSVNLLEYLLNNKNDIVNDLLNDNILYFIRDGIRINFMKNFTIVFIID
jgi:hypothetical protein